MTENTASTVSADNATISVLLRVFLPFASGYFLSYLYRTVNAVIAPDLVSSLELNAADLGLLTSAYFLTFALFQLPLGMLLDRFGPRRVERGSNRSCNRAGIDRSWRVCLFDGEF